jgi:hypothetical protein
VAPPLAEPRKAPFQTNSFKIEVKLVQTDSVDVRAEDGSQRRRKTWITLNERPPDRRHDVRQIVCGYHAGAP